MKFGNITNPMFSIFLDKATPSASTVMFGAWDVEGVDPKKSMTIV